MTGIQSIIALIITICVVVFFAKLILRLASRPVVKNYVTVSPPSGFGCYPIATPAQAYPQQMPIPPSAAIGTAEHTAWNDSAAGGELTEDEQFDDLVRDFYRR